MAFRDHIKAHHLRKGDQFALYVTRGAFHNPTRDRAQILGTGLLASGLSERDYEVAGEKFSQSVALAWTAGPLKPREGVEVQPLVPKLHFIKKKDAWFAYVRKSLVPIEDGDWELFSRVVEQHKHAS